MTPDHPSDVQVYLGAELAGYGFGHGHPFGHDRMEAFQIELERRGLLRRVQVRAPHLASAQALERFHTRDYLEGVRAQSRAGTGFLDHGDTPAFPGVFEAAAFVVGTTLEAVRAILAGECRCAFSPIAGLHHARRDAAAGFCVFNDCGVAIETLRAVYGIRRVAYVDIDAHHADGVFYAFEEDPDLIFVDLHEDGRCLYPGTGHAEETGRGPARGTKLNLPMRPGAGDQDFLAAWEQAEAFLTEGRPDFILLQCGADSMAGDPITHLCYSPAAHAHAARRVRALAQTHCQGRVLAMGGGGYDRENLAAAWSAVVEVLLEPG
ncbi:MAG: acetoin utilization protein AcuC [Gammaproteobacteria bacterium]